MAFVTQCSSCGARASVPDTAVGRTVKCPQCASLFTVAGSAPLEPPRRLAEPHYDEPVPRARRPAGNDRPRGSAMGFLGFLMGGLALLVALAALGLTWFRTPGSPLSKYNLTTPRDAVISQIQMQENADFPAIMEVTRLTNGKKVEEKLRNLEVRKEVDWKGKKVMFYAFEDAGKKHYQATLLEKHTDTGYWLPPALFNFAWHEEIRKDNPEVFEWIMSFPVNGEFRESKKEIPKDDFRNGFDKKPDWGKVKK